MEPDTPAPPPEARRIRTAREAAGMTAAQAAHASEGAVSATYWRDVERGYGGRRGQQAPARASARLLAVMARVTGVAPDELAADQREDAARVLTEIQRRDRSESESPPTPQPVPEPRWNDEPVGDAAWTLFPDDKTKRWLWRTPNSTEDERAALIAMLDRKRAEHAPPSFRAEASLAFPKIS